jgi:hypothetical protein
VSSQAAFTSGDDSISADSSTTATTSTTATAGTAASTTASVTAAEGTHENEEVEHMLFGNLRSVETVLSSESCSVEAAVEEIVSSSESCSVEAAVEEIGAPVEKARLNSGDEKEAKLSQPMEYPPGGAVDEHQADEHQTTSEEPEQVVGVRNRSNEQTVEEAYQYQATVANRVSSGYEAANESVALDGQVTTDHPLAPLPEAEGAWAPQPGDATGNSDDSEEFFSDDDGVTGHFASALMQSGSESDVRYFGLASFQFIFYIALVNFSCHLSG